MAISARWDELRWIRAADDVLIAGTMSWTVPIFAPDGLSPSDWFQTGSTVYMYLQLAYLRSFRRRNLSKWAEQGSKASPGAVAQAHCGIASEYSVVKRKLQNNDLCRIKIYDQVQANGAVVRVRPHLILGPMGHVTCDRFVKLCWILQVGTGRNFLLL
jgi:hypothetical protein